MTWKTGCTGCTGRSICSGTVCRPCYTSGTSRVSGCCTDSTSPCSSGTNCTGCTGRSICGGAVGGSRYTSSTYSIAQRSTGSTSTCACGACTAGRTHPIRAHSTGSGLIGCSCYTSRRASCTGRSICCCTERGSRYTRRTSRVCGCCTSSTSPCACGAYTAGRTHPIRAHSTGCRLIG